ncbi:GSCFA domain-containing protein [Aquicoccus sp.]|uniref:GSCFA domain-containing protein n=1 Tax=Aquicoccus sp. TaxID=2055851 RepID=UPI00356623BF
MARRPAGRRSPYADLPRAAFWRSAMRAPDEATVAALYRPKFDLTPQTRLMTAGSCFAQHLHRTLTRAGWNVLQGEGTGRLLPAALARDYGYNIYSARYGNIYTARQLRQLIEDALSDTPRPAPVWTRDGRVFDALRPTVEPHGLDSADLVQEARRDHLACVRGVLAETDVLIFTLGLTECWIDRATGLALPTAPGTVAGQYDPDTVTFHNFTYPEVLADLCASRDLLHAAGYPVRILLTVSPVPLTATASGAHVGTATTYSKSVLRAVCGMLEAQDPDFDYFPAYEIITTTAAGGPHFARNRRDPSATGVDTVLGVFAMAHGDGPAPEIAPPTEPPDTGKTAEEVACEEILLEAFRK